MKIKNLLKFILELKPCSWMGAELQDDICVTDVIAACEKEMVNIKTDGKEFFKLPLNFDPLFDYKILYDEDFINDDVWIYWHKEKQCLVRIEENDLSACYVITVCNLSKTPKSKKKDLEMLWNQEKRKVVREKIEAWIDKMQILGISTAGKTFLRMFFEMAFAYFSVNSFEETVVLISFMDIDSIQRYMDEYQIFYERYVDDAEIEECLSQGICEFMRDQFFQNYRDYNFRNTYYLEMQENEF